MKLDFGKLKPPYRAPAKLDFEFNLPADLRIAGMMQQLCEGTKKARAILRAEYERRRRCTEIKPNGEPCKAWAVWHAEEQKCLNHLSPTARAAHEAAKLGQPGKTPRPVCEC